MSTFFLHLFVTRAPKWTGKKHLHAALWSKSSSISPFETADSIYWILLSCPTAFEARQDRLGAFSHRRWWPMRKLQKLRQIRMLSLFYVYVVRMLNWMWLLARSRLKRNRIRYALHSVVAVVDVTAKRDSLTVWRFTTPRAAVNLPVACSIAES